MIRRTDPVIPLRRCASFASAMSCCCSVAPALLSILTYKTSPRS